MAEILDQMMKTAPKREQKFIRWVFALLVAATLGVLVNDGANARILRKTRPIRIRVGEQDAVLNHIFDDVEEERALRGFEHHSIAKVREEGRKRAIAEENEDAQEK